MAQAIAELREQGRQGSEAATIVANFPGNNAPPPEAEHDILKRKIWTALKREKIAVMDNALADAERAPPRRRR